MSERTTTVSATFDVGKRRFGFEVSPIFIDDEEYMTRYIVYLGIGTIRLHRFVRGDDDRSPHSHPFAFITFPFSPYWERVWAPDNGRYLGRFVVKAWRFHFRPAAYRHIVEGRADRRKGAFWTFVISSAKTQEWGFYPEPNKYVNWKDWT